MSTSENFVIAGVGTTGNLKGHAIQMTALEKVLVAVSLAAANHNPDFSIWARDLVLGPVKFTKKGDLLGGVFECNDYVAEGAGVFTFLRRTDNVHLEPKKEAFKIKFCDCLNRYGAPDLTVEFFELGPRVS